MQKTISIKVSFRLNNGKPLLPINKQFAIFIRVRGGRRFDFKKSLSFLKVFPKDWDIKNQRVKKKSHIIDYQGTNNFLSTLEAYIISNCTEQIRTNKPLNIEFIKALFDAFINPPQEETQKQKVTLFQFIDEFIDNAKTRPHYKTGKKVAPSTVITYVNARNTLKKFNDEVYKIDFKDITMQFYYDFIAFCESKNYSLSYIGKPIARLKVFMNEALEQEITDNDTFKSRKFSVPKEEAENIYLTETELRKMLDLELRNDEKLLLARDLFLIGSYTGLRVSDFNNLSEKNIKTVGTTRIIEVRTQKTDTTVSIPIHKIIKSILLRYGNNPPPKMSDQDINKYIKIVGKLANINSTEYIRQTKGGKKTEVKKLKFQLITNHTARRSFCTNAYLKGMSTLDIMAISGHTTEKSFLNYIKVKSQERALKMAKNEFFK